VLPADKANSQWQAGYCGLPSRYYPLNLRRGRSDSSVVSVLQEWRRQNFVDALFVHINHFETASLSSQYDRL
jgi:hypothetical protein